MSRPLLACLIVALTSFREIMRQITEKTTDESVRGGRPITQSDGNVIQPTPSSIMAWPSSAPAFSIASRIGE